MKNISKSILEKLFIFIGKHGDVAFVAQYKGVINDTLLSQVIQHYATTEAPLDLTIESFAKLHKLQLVDTPGIYK